MKIGIIGRTAEGIELVDGQTIKTKILVDELKVIYPKAEYLIADTYNCHKNFLKYVVNVHNCIRQGDVIFILLSSNGIKITFPLIVFFNKFYKKPLIHNVIGGRLDQVAKKNKLILWCLKSFFTNMVESQELARKLERIGVKNVEVVPNFKRLEILSEETIIPLEAKSFKFCTFSRVSRSKGITDAINAISDINKENKEIKVSLDIFGPIEAEYNEEFESLLNVNKDVIKYMGCIDYTKTVDVLKNYTALLFPTTFYGEGFPGTIIDAYSSALPVIATDWNCNPEVIDDGKTGYLYPSQSPEKLKEIIQKLIDSPDQIYYMKKQCLKKAQMYKPEIIMKKVTKSIEEGMRIYSIKK